MEDFSEKLRTLGVPELEAQVRHHNKLYWDQAKPEISDYDYDKLVNRLRELAPNSPVLSSMGESAPAADSAAAVKHKAPMLSLDKCYGNEDLAKWAQTFDGEAVMSPKFDGLACSLHYDAKGELSLAATRGDGVVGENITANAKAIADIPKKLKGAKNLEVRGEIFMRLSVFKAFKDQGFANPRNLTSGAIKQKSVEKSAAYKLSFAAYDLLGTEHKSESDKMEFLAEQGFPAIERHVLAKDKLVKGYEDLASRRPTLDFEIDGVVFKADKVSEQQRLGSNSHHPRYAIAYKFQGDSGTSVLRDLEWSVARTGAITPVALIDPVELSGAMVSKASLHHAGYIAKLGLKKNAKVVLVRRGGVIPNLEFVSEAGDEELPLPAKCPSCGSPTKLEKEFLFCTTPRTCRDAIIGQLAHYADTTGMLGFGDSILAGAVDKGFLKKPADFYTLKEEQLLQLDRMGTKVATKLLAEVDKTRTLELPVFLRAFGLHELGKHVSKILGQHFGDLDRVFAMTAAELGAIKSIGDVIAKTVVEGLVEARPVIEAVRAHVKVVNTEEANAAGGGGAAAANADGPFKGLTFVFTGKMATLNRSAAEALVKQLGGTALDSVQKTLSYLVVGDQKTDEKSSKQKAAEKHVNAGAPIKVVTETDFLAMAEKAKAQAANAGEKTPVGTAHSPVGTSHTPAGTSHSPAGTSHTPDGGVNNPGEGVNNLGTDKTSENEPLKAMGWHKAAEEASPETQLPRAKAPAAKQEPEAVAEKPVAASEAKSGGGEFAGARVLFAAKLGGATLEDAVKRVKALGGETRDAWGDDVTVVVIGSKGKAGDAVAKARAKEGVLVLKEDEFLARAGIGQTSLL